MIPDIPHIPGFILVRRIGRGGMGEVWLAKQEASGVPVAVKLLPDEASEKRRHQSEREAVASLNLHHENIVATVAIGRVKGRTWIAMEYAGGGSLDARVRDRGPLSEPEVIRAGLDAARGLREAARAGVVHRDVKPSNLLFDAEERIKVCDLGLVSEAGDTATRLRIGTPRYMAPEQLAKNDTVDRRADLYALGLTLFFAATGRSAMDGRDPTEVARQQRRVPLPDPRAFAPGLSEGLVNVLRRMTRKAPEDRYQLWDELIIDLEHLARGDSPLSAAIAVAKRTNARRRWLIPTLVVLPGLILMGFGAAAWLLPAGDRSEAVDPLEAEARGLLSFIDAESEQGMDPAEAIRRYRELVRRYPGSDAAKRARKRADRIEMRRAEAFEEAYRSISRRVATLTATGGLTAARDAVDDARSTLSATDLERIEEELREQIGGWISSVRERFDTLLGDGDIEAARALVEGAEDTDLGGLGEWRKQALVQVAAAEARRLEEGREAARREYLKILPMALRAAADGRGADARLLLDRAAAQGGELLGDAPAIDRKIIGLVALARGKIVSAGKDLMGRTVALVRGGEILTGRIETLSGEGIRLKGTSEVLALDELDAGTIRSLSAGASPETLAAFALARDDPREVAACLAGVDSPVADRMRVLAGSVRKDVPVVGPAAREGESGAAAADRLAGEGHFRAAFRLDPAVVGRFPGRDFAAARALSGRGLDLYVTGELSKSIRTFRAALAVDPFDGDIRLHLARVLLDLAERNRSPVLLDRIERHLDAGDAFRPGLIETKRLRGRLDAYRR